MSHMAINSDRRRQGRQVTRARVRLSHPVFGELDGLTSDISDHGLFVELDDMPVLPVGVHVNVQFLDSINPDIRFNAKAVRQTRLGLALVLVDYEYQGERYPLSALREGWSAPN